VKHRTHFSSECGKTDTVCYIIINTNKQDHYSNEASVRTCIFCPDFRVYFNRT